MKTILICSLLQTNNKKLFIPALILMLFSTTSFATPHVTMSLKNITTSSHTIEYDLYIINDGNTSIKLSACSFGINFNKEILNGGSITFSYLQNSRSTSLTGLTSFTLASTKVEELHQVRMTSLPLKFDNSLELIPNYNLRIGHFKMTNSVAWTENSNPFFSLQEFTKMGLTTTQIIGFIDNDIKMKALTPSLNSVATEIENSPTLNQTFRLSNSNSNEQDLKKLHLNNDKFVSKEIKIYPNPASDQINLELISTDVNTMMINITNFYGGLVKHIQCRTIEGLNKININVNELASGIYSIKIVDTNNFAYTQTFTKK